MFDSCRNENVHAMLVPYVEQVLAAGNRAQVEEHLKSCEECRHCVSVIRETLKAISVLAGEGYQPSLERHPEAAVLFAYALEQRFMPQAAIQAIARHLENCPSCQAEIDALRQIEADYQERVITVGTSDLRPALKRSQTPSGSLHPSSSGSIECSAPAVKGNLPHSTWTDYVHHYSHRLNLPRLIAAVVVILVLVYALSASWRNGDSPADSLGDVADKTADAIATLPSPSASSITVVLSVEEGQHDQLCYILQRNNIPFEDIDGKVRVSAENATKAQQLWIEAVERSQAEATGGVIEESQDSYVDTGSPENSETAAESESSDSYSDYSSSAPSEAVQSDDSYSAAPAETSYAAPPADTGYSAPVQAPDLSVNERPAPSSPKPILRPLHQSSSTPKSPAYVAPARSTTTSSSARRSTPKASHPQPKPAIVMPTATAPAASASSAVEREVSSDAPVRPNVVRMGSQPSVGSSEASDDMVVTPTPRSVYEDNGADNSTALGSWSNDL